MKYLLHINIINTTQAPTCYFILYIILSTLVDVSVEYFLSNTYMQTCSLENKILIFVSVNAPRHWMASLSGNVESTCATAALSILIKSIHMLIPNNISIWNKNTYSYTIDLILWECSTTYISIISDSTSIMRNSEFLYFCLSCQQQLMTKD